MHDVICPKCGKIYQSKRFNQTGTCWACRGKERYQRNKEYYQQFKEQGCYNCDEKDTDLIDAHHITRKNKRKGRYRGIGFNMNCGPFKKELDEQCIPLCVRCHRKVTLGKLSFPEFEVA